MNWYLNQQQEPLPEIVIVKPVMIETHHAEVMPILFPLLAGRGFCKR